MSARQIEKPKRYQNEVKLLAARLRALRHERGWTYEEAAEHTDLDLKHLQKIEAGALNVTLVTLVRLAEGFGVELWRLFLTPER